MTDQRAGVTTCARMCDGARGDRPRLRPAPPGDRIGVTRISIAYWSLMSVLGALALFLLAAASPSSRRPRSTRAAAAPRS